MADLEFALPLPPSNGNREEFFLNTCRDRAWGAVGDIPPLERKYWPTSERIRCEVLLYTKTQIEDTRGLLQPVIDAVGQVLWDRRTAQPMLMIQQFVNGEKEQAVFRITRRKLVSEGAGKHYEW